MTKGFGPQKEIKKAPSEAAKKRMDAAKQMDAMKADGLPEFEIYIRIKDKKSWFPVGAIAVQRTNQVDAAIFANEESLRQGAFRIFPVLKKSAQNLEYGYRSKDNKEDPITLAVKPAPGVQGAVQALVSNISESVTGLFKKKKEWN
jgi:Family of unknown function (DUF6523)